MPWVRPPPNAEQLDIYAAPVFNLALIGLHMEGYRGQAVGHDGVFPVDGDMVKQVFLHEAAVALRMIGRKTSYIRRGWPSGRG